MYFQVFIKKRYLVKKIIISEDKRVFLLEQEDNLDQYGYEPGEGSNNPGGGYCEHLNKWGSKTIYQKNKPMGFLPMEHGKDKPYYDTRIGSELNNKGQGWYLDVWVNGYPKGVVSEMKKILENDELFYLNNDLGKIFNKLKGGWNKLSDHEKNVIKRMYFENTIAECYGGPAGEKVTEFGQYRNLWECRRQLCKGNHAVYDVFKSDALPPINESNDMWRYWVEKNGKEDTYFGESDYEKLRNNCKEEFYTINKKLDMGGDSYEWEKQQVDLLGFIHYCVKEKLTTLDPAGKAKGMEKGPPVWTVNGEIVTNIREARAAKIKSGEITFPKNDDWNLNYLFNYPGDTKYDYTVRLNKWFSCLKNNCNKLTEIKDKNVSKKLDMAHPFTRYSNVDAKHGREKSESYRIVKEKEEFKQQYGDGIVSEKEAYHALKKLDDIKSWINVGTGCVDCAEVKIYGTPHPSGSYSGIFTINTAISDVAMEELNNGAVYKCVPKTRDFIEKHNIPAYAYTKIWKTSNSWPSEYSPCRGAGCSYFDAFETYYGTNNINYAEAKLRKYGNIITSNFVQNNQAVTCTLGSCKYVFSDEAHPIEGEPNLLTKVFTGIGDFAVSCASDYHCLLDLASIAALAIPGAGIFIAAGIDLANSASYFYEASQAEDGSEKDWLYVGGALTLVGILPGASKAIKMMRSSDKVVKEALGKISKEVGKKNGKVIGSEWEKIINDATKGLTVKQEKELLKIFNAIKKSGPEIRTTIDKIKKLKSGEWVDLISFTKKDKNFQKFLNGTKSKAYPDGDLLYALQKFIKTQAGKDALTQVGLYASLYAALPPLIEYSGEALKKMKKVVFGETLDEKITSSGWDPAEVKQFFWSNKTTKDNGLLSDAWDTGWRPYEKDSDGNPKHTDKMGNFIPIIVDPRFRTEKYKKWYGKRKKEQEKIEKQRQEIRDKGLEGSPEEIIISNKALLKKIEENPDRYKSDLLIFQKQLELWKKQQFTKLDRSLM